MDLDPGAGTIVRRAEDHAGKAAGSYVQSQRCLAARIAVILLVLDVVRKDGPRRILSAGIGGRLQQ